MLKINVPARVHMSLIDLGTHGYRRNGGLGFCINEPTASFSYVNSANIDLSLLASVGYSTSDISAVEMRLRKMQQVYNVSGIKLIEASIPGRHIGLGSGTATALATVEAMNLLNDLELTSKDLMAYSGRGGASGIGLHGYFKGGFVFDIGRKFDDEIITSSDDTERIVELPFALQTLQMPDWKVGIFRSVDAKAVSAETEKRLFLDILPLSQESVYETTYHSVFGSLAAVAVQDFDSFCLALNALQQCEWKRAEINLHGPHLLRDMKKLLDLGCDAVGMSSVGPTLFFLAKDFNATRKRIEVAYPLATLFTSSPNNQGRAISYA